MAYLGNTPTTQSFSPAIDYFSGNGSTTAFTLSRAVAAVAQVQVVIENVPQNPTDAFTVSGSTITFTSAPPSGTNNIYVYYTSPITQVIQPGQGTVGTTQIVDGSVTQAKLAPGAGSQWTTSSSNIYYNTGNVGVGTTSPSRNLSVVNSSAPHIQLALSSDQASGNGFELAYDGSANYIAGRENVPTIFSTNNTERMRIDSSGRVTTPYQPCFYAYAHDAGLNTGFSSGSVMPFGTIVTNVGSGYSSSTNRFTAPIAGNYVISVQVAPGNITSNNTWVATRIRKNGSIASGYSLGHVTNQNNNQYDTVGMTIILSLSANDYVDAIVEYNTFNGNCSYGNFSGFLLG